MNSLFEEEIRLEDEMLDDIFKQLAKKPEITSNRELPDSMCTGELPVAAEELVIESLFIPVVHPDFPLYQRETEGDLTTVTRFKKSDISHLPSNFPQPLLVKEGSKYARQCNKNDVNL